jgi:hypothetical protein
LVPSVTGTDFGEVAETPSTVQVIVPLPAVVHVTFAGVVLSVPLGPVIVTVGGMPRSIVRVSVPVPAVRVHETLTVVVLGAAARVTLVLAGVVFAVPFNVQVVPDGIVDAPSTV